MSKTRTLAMMAVAALLLASGVRIAAEPSATPRLDWLFDARVATTARVGNRLYVGGQFRKAWPASSPTANHFSALSPTTGALVPSIIPAANGSVTAVLLDGSGGYFIAGRFTNIGTAKVAHILADGALDPAFQFPHVIEGVITQLARVGPSLVAAGTLLHVDAVFRPLFAMNPVTGALSSWAPVLPNQDLIVRSLQVSNGLLIVLAREFSGRTFVAAYDGVSGAVVWQTDVTGAPGQLAQGAMGLSGNRLIVGMGRLYSLDPLTGAVDPTWAAGMPIAEGLLITMAIGPSAIYVGGTFQSFWGQPRGRLAAVDPATGTLLPWSPQATTTRFDSGFIGSLALSPTGSVFAASLAGTGPLTINGQVVGTVAEIDTAGALTAFRSAAPVESVDLLQMSSTNTLFVSGFSGYVGQVARSAIAGFDLTTGAALPNDITVAGSFANVEQLAGVGNVLYLRGGFATVNGQPRNGLAAVDVTSNTVLPWPAAGVTVSGFGPITPTHMYIFVNDYAAGVSYLRRLDAATGAVDPSWRPTVNGSLMLDRGVMWIYGNVPSSGLARGTFVGTLDLVTAEYREVLRTFDFLALGDLRVDGDTLYITGSVLPGQNTTGRVIYAFDRRTGLPVWRPPVAGLMSRFAVADGRVIVAGRNLSTGPFQRFGLFEIDRLGVPTAWDSGFRPSVNTPLLSTVSFDLYGNILAAIGDIGDFVYRVAAYELSGANAPAGLRSTLVGVNTVFTWDPMAVPPPGGYVIEGGFASGQAAGAIAVGNATSVALPMPAGPVFIRVRAQGSTEVSNEIVAGCFAPPLPPTALTTTLSGINLTLSWTAPADAVTGYTLQAGTAAGLSNVATLALGPQPSISGPVAGGTFFARVTASNACGTSGPSGEVFFTIGAPDPLPAAPTNLASSLSGNTVSLSWTAPAGAVAGYVLEAGTGAGLANLGTLRVGATPSLVVPGVPAGTYVLRVRAITSAGSGAPSSDVVAVVP